MKKITRQIISMTSAVALGCSAVLSSGLTSALAAAAQDAAEARELVPVIVRLSGEAVLSGNGAAQQGTDYLDTAEARAKTSALRQISNEAEAEIRSLYPDLEVGYHFELLTNGFSCELPKGVIDEARSCRWVEDISEIKTLTVSKPELYYAHEMGEVNFFGETTGYFGEGEVIAVLDTELDITHSMFAPIDDKDNKLTKDDIIAVAGELNAKIDPEKAYISSKLPYVIDYAGDNPYDIADEENYHGTHVAGIAAGDMITDNSGMEISGIARDAQIVMMGVCDYIYDEDIKKEQFSISDDAMLAALEDAAKLKVDVINMSFGSPKPDYATLPSADIISVLNNAGITLVTSAGNYANNHIIEGQYLDMDASVPDTSTVVEPSALNECISVAAADNSFLRTPCFLIEGLDDEIAFTDSGNDKLISYFGDGVYDYVYCGLGMPEDFEGKDVEGKIVLLDRGAMTFTEKEENAVAAGAAAMIVCDNVEGDASFQMILDNNSIPAVFISLNDGNKMKDAESKKLRIDSTRMLVTPLDGGISSFSSFGPTGDLTIKPDIAGIGGSVSSSGYDNSIELMDGTSMASPYVAGCVAVFDQYLKKNGIEVSGAEKTAFIKNLMMNSAVLFSNGDTYESPRRQGAGLVNMKNVLNDRVILTGESGLAKVELKDKLTDKLSFNVDIRNFSDEDVEFKEAKLVLTAEDGGQLEGDESGQLTILGASNISVDADLSSLLKTTAGESRTVKIDAQLNADELAYHGFMFPNGFFVEGYIVLSGAENCCDISIPVMGFCGDWAAIPIFHNGTQYLPTYTLFSNDGPQTFNSCYSFSGFIEAVYQLLDRLPEEEALEVFSDPSTLMGYIDEDFMLALNELSQDSLYISPDGDGMSDKAGVLMSMLRSAYITGIKIYNSSNELVSESPSRALPSHMQFVRNIEDDITDLPDGEYTGVLEGHIYYEGADQNPQSYSFPIVIDKTKPELEVTGREENGRKLIDITATDDNLDAVYVMGKGKGGVAGEYTEESEPLMELYAAMAAVPSLLAADGDPEIKVTSDSILISALMGTEDQFIAGLIANYDHSDIIPAYRYQDGDGNIKITYDVTDLEDYVVSAIDKGFNTTEKRIEDETPPSLRTGLWWATGEAGDVYYNIWDGENGLVRYQDGTPETSFTYSVDGENITMVLSNDAGDITRTGKMSFTDKNNAVVSWDDGIVENWSFKSYSGFAAFDFSSNPEIKEMVIEYHNENNDKKAASAELTFGEDGLADIVLFDKEGKKIAEYTDFDRFTNKVTTPAGEQTEIIFLRKGVYRVSLNPEGDTNHYYVLYSGDGSVKVASVENGALYECTAEYTDGVMCLNKGKEDEQNLSLTRYSNTDAMIAFPDGRQYYVNYLSVVPQDRFMVYTASELEDMAGAYCERIRGERPSLVSTEFLENGDYLMKFSDGQAVETDPFSAWSTDQAGEWFFLTELPEIRDLFKAGLWSCTTDGRMLYYSIDGKGNIRVTDPEDGSEYDMDYKWTGIKALELTTDGITEKAIAAPLSDEEIALVRNETDTDMLRYVREESLDSTSFYSNKELAEMAAKDRSDKTGKSAVVTETVNNEDGTVTLKFDDGTAYKIDRFTGTGTDGNGNEVDLPQTGNNDITSAAAAAGAGMLVLLGSAAVFFSGILRRRRDSE